MRTNTELVFILDKSGSMGGLERDTIGGYNAMLEMQKTVAGAARLTTVLFADTYERLHDRVDLRTVPPMTAKEYAVGGSTALLDAIGRTIHDMDQLRQGEAESGRAGKVLFVITTDGMENASREYSYDQIKALIERQRSRYGWEFVFLGANIDAIGVAGRFGIAPGRAQNYHADEEGTRLNYATMASAITRFRKTGELAEDWGDEIRADFERRGSGSANGSPGGPVPRKRL